jgi:hypothetical protein
MVYVLTDHYPYSFFEKQGSVFHRLLQSCFPFYPDEGSGCSLQSGLVYLGKPYHVKPDSSEMPIFSIGRSGGGAFVS